MKRVATTYLAALTFLALGAAGAFWNSALAAGGGRGRGGGGAGGAGGGAASRPAATAASSPAALYAGIVDKYLASKWEDLPADLAKTKDIAALTKDQQADVAYIKQAVADGRPSWWDTVKQGKKVNIQTKIWQKTLNTTFDPALDPGTMNMQQVGGQLLFSLSWLSADMDSTTPTEHGFTKGDLAYVGIWGALETVQLYGGMQLQRLGTLDEKEHTQLNRFLVFRGALAAGYYGTPRARRWAAFLSCDAYVAAHLTNDGLIPRRPFAVMLEEEIVSHAPQYPSFKIPRTPKADTVEVSLATNLMGQFEKTTLTFAEDKALREAIKDFALANTTAIYAGGKVMLPSKLTIALDPAEDGTAAADRQAWLMEEIAHPGIHAQAASKPATKPGTATKPATASRP